jgi:hypothetical protein
LVDLVNLKVSLALAASVKAFSGAGESAEIASGEKKREAALPSLVANEMVSPLTTGTEAALGT